MYVHVFQCFSHKRDKTFSMKQLARWYWAKNSIPSSSAMWLDSMLVNLKKIEWEARVKSIWTRYACRAFSFHHIEWQASYWMLANSCNNEIVRHKNNDDVFSDRKQSQVYPVHSRDRLQWFQNHPVRDEKTLTAFLLLLAVRVYQIKITHFMYNNVFSSFSSICLLLGFSSFVLLLLFTYKAKIKKEFKK